MSLRMGNCIAFIAVLIFLFYQSSVQADVVSVNCGEGGSGLQAAINGLSSPNGPHTIHVTGTCVENIFIDGITNLTIQGSDGTVIRSAAPDDGTVFTIGSARGINLQGLTVDGDNQEFVAGLTVFDSSVSLSGCTIINNTDLALFADGGSTVILGGPNPGSEILIRDNLAGVFANHSTLRIRGRTTIEDNVEDALVVVNGVLQIGNRPPEAGNVFRNNGFGIAILNNGFAGINGSNLIENNGPYGVLIARVPNASFNGSMVEGIPRYTTIQGHTLLGILVTSSTVGFGASDPDVFHQIRNNGTAPVTVDAGIYVIRPGSFLARQVEIANNTGAGIVLDGGAYSNFATARISGNSGDGVVVTHNATAEFGTFLLSGTGDPIAANTLISGNGGQAIACDETAVIYGDLSGLPVFKCKTEEQKTKTGSTVAEIKLEERVERHQRRSKH
ncbi:hypothetical protein L0222_14470 [bacterium]|nr:hypothetical protein [bacterium]MCI0601533.1 hypothetical protein [bacterium]